MSNTKLFAKQAISSFKPHYIFVAVFGILLGIMSVDTIAYAFVLTALSFFYQRSEKEWVILTIAYLLSTLVFGWIHFYFSIIIVTFYILMVKFIVLLKQNIFYYFPFIVAVSALFASLMLFESLNDVFLITALAFGSCKLSQNHWIWMDHEFKVSDFIIGLILFAIGMLGGVYLLPQEQVIMFSFLFVIMGQFIDSKVSLLFLLMHVFIFKNIDIWMLASISSWLLSKQSKHFGIWIYVSILFFSGSFQNLLGLGSLIVIYYCIPFEWIKHWILPEYIEANHDEMMDLKRQHLANQMKEFSAIFNLVGQYYKDTYQVESTFAESLSLTLQELSKQVVENVSVEDELYHKIIRVLEGYHFEVTRLKIHQEENGQWHIILHVVNLKKGEEQEMILPLLRFIVDKQLELVKFERTNVFDGFFTLEFVGSSPYKIQTKGYKIKTKREISGDTYAVYEDHKATICTISDGMGTGKQANELSKLVTTLFQRMMSANIPIETSVKCINLLLKQDGKEQFATLDILYFDQLNNEVYICKSGASPTYLYRNKEVYAIHGESLPIGIIEEIETDCYRLKCEKEDIFIMTSDGIHSSIVDYWFNQYTENTVEERIESYVTHVQKSIFNDDATILLAKVL